MAFKYPTTRRDETVQDDYHGTKVADPYRWLEDPDSEETKHWVGEQNQITNSFLAECPDREKIKGRLEETYNYVKIGCPFKRGGQYFFYKNDGLQNQHVLYKQQSLDSEASVLLDPNQLSKDGTAALGSIGFAQSAEHMAYGLSKSGSDWQTIHVVEVDSTQHLPDKVEWCKFTSIAWTHDNKGFFYTRYPVPKSLDTETDENKRGAEVEANLNQKVYYHRVGTDQSMDELIFATPENPKWMFGLSVSQDGNYLLITISESTAPVNRLYFSKISDGFQKDQNGLLEVVKIVDNFDAEYNYITNKESVFYFKTNLKAPKYKVISLDFQNPESGPQDVIQQTSDVLEDVTCVNQDYLVSIFNHNVQSVLQLYRLNGEFVKNIPLPGIGTIVSLTGREKDTEFLYSFTSFLTPTIIYRYDFNSQSTTVFYQTQVKGIDPSQFVTQQVWFDSKDGTKVPMFIVHKKDLKLDGNNPTMLYGYGGFSISLMPSFSVFVLNFVHHFNAIYAVPNIRGGAEFGEEWHEAGTKDRKQNVFDDFQAAAEYLIKNNYTNPKKLGIRGGSNGGLLVGACLNQRPDLFACANPAVGVMDMLRFHKFTIGYAWTADYGCSDNASEFDYLYPYSPIHNIRVNPNSQYPAVLVTTSDHDDRVVPLHSFKYIAELQHTVGSHPSQTNPLLVRIDVNAGHGAGKPTSKIIDEFADVYGFFAKNLGASFSL